MLTKLNQCLYTLINASADASTLIIKFATFCAQYLIYLPVLVICFLWFKKPCYREMISKIILVLILTFSITIILRVFIVHPRPLSIPIGTNFLPYRESNSFPSKHAVFIFSIAFSLLFYTKHQLQQKLLFIMSLMIAILVGWSRVYLGVHWPLDIVAAIVISFAMSCLVNRFWFKYRAPIMLILLTSYRIIFYPLIRLGISKY